MEEKNEVKQKKPLYKRPWFIILAVIAVIGFARSGLLKPLPNKEYKRQTVQPAENTAQESPEQSGQTAETPQVQPEEEHEYQICIADDLFEALKNNALNAKNTYNGQYIELSGVLNNMDSDGAYFGVGAFDQSVYDSVTCSIKNEEQKNIIAGFSTGDMIIVRGKITEVGDILGYYMDVDEIVVAE